MSQHQVGTRRVETDPDRFLTVDVTGAPEGYPVFLLHGMPGSRSGPRPRTSVLYRLGVQLISYDRPGYGGSTRKKGRTVADAAEDVAAIARDLHIDHFAVVGRSGGGPHALACAALLPKSVVRTVVLVGVAPAESLSLDWYNGMTDSNVRAYDTLHADTSMLVERLRLRAERTLRDPESLIEALSTEMKASDKRVVSDIAIRRLLAETYTEALKAGPWGWIDDMFALRGDWGFDLGTITGAVRLWHGADDNFSPVDHTHWLASQIPGAEVQVQPGSAHFGAVEILPDMFAWLTAPSRDLVTSHPGAPD